MDQHDWLSSGRFMYKEFGWRMEIFNEKAWEIGENHSNIQTKSNLTWTWFDSQGSHPLKKRYFMRKNHIMLTRPAGMGFVKSYFLVRLFPFLPFVEEKKVLWNSADLPARFVNFFFTKYLFFLKDCFPKGQGALRKFPHVLAVTSVGKNYSIKY